MKVRDHFKGLGLGGRIMLNCILNGFRMCRHVDQAKDKWGFLSECSKEPSSSIKSMEFLD